MNPRTAEALETVQEIISPLARSHLRLLPEPDEYTFMVKYPRGTELPLEHLPERIEKALADAPGLTLYHHMPVCRYRCTFCHYPTVVAPRRVAEWVKTTIAEARLFRDRFPAAAHVPCSSFYIGGGTPSLMTGAQLAHLIESYAGLFDLEEGAEIASEGTPDTLTPKRITEMRAAGVNRLSIGVQTLDDDLLKKTGRHHTSADATRAIRDALTAGFASVNVDLIYGLPRQTPDAFLGDVEQVIAMRPPSITLYRLRLGREGELPTTIERQYRHRPDEFPPVAAAYAMQLLGRDALQAVGYEEGPAGWFHRPGAAARVYDDRWRRQVPLVAFGWRAYSYASSYEYYNRDDEQAYREALDSKRLPVKSAVEYSLHDSVRRFACFSLKATLRLDRAPLDSRYSRETWRPILGPSLEALREIGVLAADDAGYLLTPSGLLLIEEIVGRVLG